MRQDDLYYQLFGEDVRRESYRFVPHPFRLNLSGKHYCGGCGLIANNNNFTQWAIDKGCLNHLHQDHERTRKKFTKVLTQG